MKDELDQRAVLGLLRQPEGSRVLPSLLLLLPRSTPTASSVILETDQFTETFSFETWSHVAQVGLELVT